MLVIAEPAVMKGRRFGNLVLVAGRAPLPVGALRIASARAAFPRTVHAGSELARFTGGAAPLTDADPMRSPAPPDAAWRIGG